MAKTQAVAKLDEPEAAAPTSAREVKPLKPTAVSLQHDGQIWRTLLVRLAAEHTLQDLQDDPTLWRAVQGNPHVALRKYDRLMIVSHDEAWLIKDALVTEADHQRVVLSIRPGDVIRMAAKSAEWSDDRHVIMWETSGWAIFRKSDGVVMLPQRFSSLDAARSEMYRQFYSKPQAQRVA